MTRRGKENPSPRPNDPFHVPSLSNEEASVKVQLSNHNWEPTIQLLRFEDGSETLRFCVFHGKQFSRMPLLISPDELDALLEETSKHPRIKTLLKTSATRL